MTGKLTSTNPAAQDAHAPIDAVKDTATTPENTVSDIRDRVQSTVEIQPSLKDKLSSELSGVGVVSEPEWLPEKLGNRKIISIDISDKKAMHDPETLKKFAPYFGRLIHEVFEPREEGKESAWKPEDPDFMEEFIKDYFVEGDLSSAEKIYCITENDNIIGFYLLKYNDLPDGKRSAHVLLTTLDRPRRGTGANEMMSRTVFQNEKADAFTGITHTPELVKSWARLGTMTGMDFYFCGRKNGDAAIPLSPKEEAELAILLEHDINKQVKGYGMEENCKGLPPHYISYGKAAIAPRKLEEVRLSPTDPVYHTFQELVQFQQTNKPDEGLYGTVILIPRRQETF